MQRRMCVPCRPAQLLLPGVAACRPWLPAPTQLLCPTNPSPSGDTSQSFRPPAGCAACNVGSEPPARCSSGLGSGGMLKEGSTCSSAGSCAAAPSSLRSCSRLACPEAGPAGGWKEALLRGAAAAAAAAWRCFAACPATAACSAPLPADAVPCCVCASSAPDGRCAPTCSPACAAAGAQANGDAVLTAAKGERTCAEGCCCSVTERTVAVSATASLPADLAEMSPCRPAMASVTCCVHGCAARFAAAAAGCCAAVDCSRHGRQRSESRRASATSAAVKYGTNMENPKLAASPVAASIMTGLHKSGNQGSATSAARQRRREAAAGAAAGTRHNVQDCEPGGALRANTSRAREGQHSQRRGPIARAPAEFHRRRRGLGSGVWRGGGVPEGRWRRFRATLRSKHPRRGT